MKKLVNFHRTTQKSENFFSMGSFVQSIQGLSYKNTEELCFMTLNRKGTDPKGTEELCVITLQNDTKFEKELTYALKNDMGNLANFDTTFESLKNRSLMGSF